MIQTLSLNEDVDLNMYNPLLARARMCINPVCVVILKYNWRLS
jgi:hypothetical protein